MLKFKFDGIYLCFPLSPVLPPTIVLEGLFNSEISVWNKLGHRTPYERPHG